jgi:hypothetical protein
MCQKVPRTEKPARGEKRTASGRQAETGQQPRKDETSCDHVQPRATTQTRRITRESEKDDMHKNERESGMTNDVRVSKGRDSECRGSVRRGTVSTKVTTREAERESE